MPTPHESYARAFAAARLARELARDVHGNLAAVGVAPLDGSTLGDEFAAAGDELNAIALRLVELRERSAAIARRHVDTNAARLRPNFGYCIASRDGTRRVTTASSSIAPRQP